MKTFISILLFGLLGFLGCSGSNDGTSAVTGEASPVTPFGIIDILDPSYQWTPVPGASRYHLLVQEAIEDSTTQDSTETYIIDEWHTAEEAGCASEEVLCTVHPGIVTIGENTWKVQACASQECGLWSEPLNYDVSPTPVSTETRFTFNGDGTVTDNNTRLMWAIDVGAIGITTWARAIRFCNDLVLPASGYSDWRLPTLYEIFPLFEALSLHTEPIYYWTSTEQWGPEVPSMVWCVYTDGHYTTYVKMMDEYYAHVMPVREVYH